MLLLVSLLLLAVGITLLMLTAGLLVLQGCLKFIICLCEGRFIAAGIWLCIGIALLNLFFGEGESFAPLYIAIMIAALAAVIAKYLSSRLGNSAGPGRFYS